MLKMKYKKKCTIVSRIVTLEKIRMNLSLQLTVGKLDMIAAFLD